MISPNLHFYSPNASQKTEHPLWVHDSPVFLKALQDQLIQRFKSRYPTFIFVVRGTVLSVQIHLEGEYKSYRPGEYSPDFIRFIDFCGGFELGWTAGWTTAQGQR